LAKEGQTEKATPKKIKDAREKGNLPQSKDFALFLNLIGFTVFLSFFGSWFVKEIMVFEQTALGMMTNDMDIFQYFKKMFVQMVLLLLPLSGLSLAFICLNYIFQVRFLFSLKVIKPDPQRINPQKFFSNLFNRKTFIQIIKQILLVAVIGYIVYTVFVSRLSDMTQLINNPWNESVVIMWGIFKEVISKLLMAMIVIAMLDFFYQRWEHSDNLKMKKDEVKREHRENEGSPEVKSRQNQRRIAILKNETNRKMKSEVTFLTTNPTHYAVGIYFKPGHGNPRVVLKGIDNIALYMKETAKKYDVPIYEDPPLTRDLYNKVLEGAEVPEELWAALSIVMRRLIALKEIKF